MSNREKIIIEADDVTLIQGEKMRDYSVKVTKEDGSPIPHLQLTIAFYNLDYSFPQEVVTNNYGVASIPLYLTGESWKVDVHFKGDEHYLPNYVTKEITIQRFEKLMSEINSSNLHINEDDVISSGEGYYTIQLKDENGLKISQEPVSFTIISSKESVDNVEMILKTDDEGKIELPYLTHDDTVTIVSEYKGCTRYAATINSDVVSFDDIPNRTEVFFGEYNDGQGNNYLQIKRGEQGQWQGIYDSGLIERCIVNYEGDDRTVHDGILYYRSSNINSYQITLFYKGDSNYFSKCETLYFHKEEDIRMTLWQWIFGMTGDVPVVANLKVENIYKGEMSRVMLDCYFELPYEPVYLGIKQGTYDGTYDMVVKALPTYVPNAGRWEPKTKVYFDIIIPSGVDNNCFFSAFLKQNDYIKNATDPNEDIVITSITETLRNTTLEDATFMQTGFGYLHRTYQEIDVLVRNNQAISYDKINEYYIMRLMNTDTYEEFYFYSYLVDNVTSSHISFLLGLGNWEMYVVSKETSNYKGTSYSVSAELDTEEFISYNMDTFFDSSKWTDNGDGEIDDYIDITGRTIEYSSTQFNELNSVMNEEYISANIYNLSFLWDCQYYEEYGFNEIMINVDEENYIQFNPYKVIECQEGIIVEEKIINKDYFSHAQYNVLIERKGDTFNIYYDDDLVYTSSNAINNIIKLYCMGQGMFTKISNVVIDESIEPIDITPSTDDYDGSIYGSDLHMEIREGKVNLYDYGMLPSGAIKGANVVVNEIPVTADEMELKVEMRYNNTRFERLNDLNGEIKIRAYENTSTNDTNDYSKLLCSPMVVPNAETVFTRHSEEGILYYVKDPKMVGTNDISPTYLCNAYTQYKGGVEIKTETGISLFDLDNAYSPVFVGNNLVRAEFHRRSGYIKLSVWDNDGLTWHSVNILKIKDTPQLKLIEYNDDYAEIQFGQTIWKFYRGRPFIIVNHSHDDLRLLNLVDRVYCEVLENDRSMGFIEEHDALFGVFEPQLSIQKFKQELHIGQNIRLDNFEVYDVEPNNNLIDPSQTNELRLTKMDNENAISLVKNGLDKTALNFPSYSQYVKNCGYDSKNPNLKSDFSLLIQSVKTENCSADTMNVIVKARGFDERGAIPVNNQIQYGIWQQSHEVEVDTTTTDEIRVEFTDCPSSVKYIDFVLIFEANDDMVVTMKDFMYYEGKDMSINHDVDTSTEYANRVDIVFNETYYANLYDDDDSYGLSVIRPNQQIISLRKIYASEETVLVPYMKKSSEWDKPSRIFLEYLNAKRQIMDIDWEN